jgi:hypothetical protein
MADHRMRLSRPFVKTRLLLMLVAVPLITWFAVKPVRVVAPGLMGMHCLNASVCVDDPSRLVQAAGLYAEGMAFVPELLGPFKGKPRVIFCASQACADAFGLGARAAVTLGTWGTVIGPRAWESYFVRHELIHYAQAERIGTLRLLFKPQWFVEGMAYALSQDPRQPLTEPFESQRRRFLAWYGTVGKPALWQAARDL